MIKNGSEVTYREQGDALIVVVGGEVDHHGAVSVRTGIDGILAARRPSMVYLDLSAVSFMDSSGLGLIMGRLAKAKEIGASLILRNPSARVTRMIRMAGLDRIIQTTKT